MEGNHKRRWKIVLRLLECRGIFLMEAMIGTAILSIVMVFFATVCISAFMLMQRAYRETEISEEVFMKVESHRYSELSMVEKSGTPIAQQIVLNMKEMGDSPSGSMSSIYIKYKAADNTEGFLTSMDMSALPDFRIQEKIYAYRYQGGRGDEQISFYLLKGEK